MKSFHSTLLGIVVSMFALICCTKAHELVITQQPPKETGSEPVNEAKSITFLALGDSYTIGHGVAEADRFPRQTAVLLAQSNITTTKLQYIATNGWTTFDLQAAIRRTPLDSSYTIVTLLIGVNDQYQGVPIEEYSTRFTETIEKSIALAGNDPSHVFVISIPDYSVTPFVPTTSKEKVSSGIDQFNRVNYQIALAYHCNYTDVTSISRQSGDMPGMLVGDGLHPSAKQYGLWSDQLAKLIAVQLK